MSLRNSKEEIIKEIRDLRTLINGIQYEMKLCPVTVKIKPMVNWDKKEEALRQLNKIQDKVFNI